jgi:hypothetical protein
MFFFSFSFRYGILIQYGIMLLLMRFRFAVQNSCLFLFGPAVLTAEKPCTSTKPKPTSVHRVIAIPVEIQYGVLQCMYYSTQYCRHKILVRTYDIVYAETKGFLSQPNIVTHLLENRIHTQTCYEENNDTSQY